MLFDFLEFFWPTFIKKDGYIFLKEAFSEEEYTFLLCINTIKQDEEVLCREIHHQAIGIFAWSQSICALRKTRRSRARSNPN